MCLHLVTSALHACILALFLRSSSPRSFVVMCCSSPQLFTSLSWSPQLGSILSSVQHSFTYATYISYFPGTAATMFSSAQFGWARIGLYFYRERQTHFDRMMLYYQFCLGLISTMTFDICSIMPVIYAAFPLVSPNPKEKEKEERRKSRTTTALCYVLTWI